MYKVFDYIIATLGIFLIILFISSSLYFGVSIYKMLTENDYCAPVVVTAEKDNPNNE